VAVEEGRYTRWCFFVAEGWRDYLEKPIEDVCAFQYRVMNDAILNAKKSIPTAQWTEVFYEDLVRDPVEGFRHAFQSCGLTFTPKLEKHCAQVLSKPYNAFSAIRLDKWREGRNREKIERVTPAFEDTAKAMGYSAL